MEKIKRFFECLLPVTACNLECGYCYVIQRNNRHMKIPTLKYTPEWIGKALNKERLGGICFFSICGAGETLLPNYTIDIVKNILKQEHIVNITTNGTLTNRFIELSKLPEEYRKRLNISFSLHYNELKNRKLLDVFVENVKRMKENGISFVVQLNLCDEYINELDEIKEFSKENFWGALPQLAATRKESNDLKKIDLDTELSFEEYKKIGESFKSPLFEYTMKNLNKKRTEFCYAGDWSGTLNLENGILQKCYADPRKQNIFENIEKPIKFEAIGCNCMSRFCFNSSHFMSLGIIPELDNDITYGQLRNREIAGWYSDTVKQVLNNKLNSENKEYTKIKKIYVTVKSFIYLRFRKVLSIMKRIFIHEKGK